MRKSHGLIVPPPPHKTGTSLNKIKTGFGIIALVVVIGFTMFGCDDGKDPCANGHDFPAWIAPSCEVAGNSERSCTRSGCNATDTKTEGFAALTHDWLYDPGAKPPTCTETGLGHRHCQRAGCNADEAGTTPYPIDPNNHDWSALATISEGVQAKTCNRVSCNGKEYVFQYVIGDTGPAGGIIFYVADEKDERPDGITIQGYSGATGSFAEYTAYYFEAAPANETASEIRWGAGTGNTLIDGNTSWENTSAKDAGLAASIGVGRKDTQTIVNSAAFAALTNTAAQRCVNKNTGGKTDWFLPSLGELNEMYKAKAAGVAGLPTTAYFWSSSQSSSQYSNGSTWSQNFANGDQGTSSGGFNSVRAIRAFQALAL